MRLISGVPALAILAWNLQLASASSAYVFEYDGAGGPKNTDTRSLSPSIARVVLAQRIGVEDFHISGAPSDEEIEAINAYGTRTQLFGEKKPDLRAIFLAPADVTKSKNDLYRNSVFVVQDVPPYSTTKNLFQDLVKQTDGLTSSQPPVRASDYLTSSQLLLKHEEAPLLREFSNADDALMAAEKLMAQNYIVTVVLSEPGQDGSSWGAYQMPGQSAVHKRQSSHRLQDEEEPLSAFTSIVSIPSLHDTASNSSKSSNSSNNKPLHGILPACYSSKSSCESTTRGCTGHGACSLKYTNDDAKAKKECWACACNATQSNGLTTYWSGPACQKKDISVEFWLITLFTVGLISLVGFAVGTIWSMGEEDLPSVIGAGVSGPTARK